MYQKKVGGNLVKLHAVGLTEYIDAQSTPELAYNAASGSKTYLAISIDLDAPFQTFSFLSPILHWVQPGLKSTDSSTLQTSESCIANWGPPKPPGPSGPHRYLFLLYEQPGDFNAEELMWPEGQTLSLSSRVRFDLDAWEKKANLAPAIAANYFNSH